MAATTTPRRGRTPVQATKADRGVLRWTGAAGLGAAMLPVATAPLYVSMGAPPSLSDGDALTAYLARNQVPAITTKLVDTFYVLAFIVFAAGLRHLIRRTDAGQEWVAALVFGSPWCCRPWS